jgi:PIN domain nuclease of toxin-antitoxin system
VDSATLLWWFAGDPRLGDGAREAIEDPSTEAFVSVASAWEISIKHATGKLTLDVPVTEILDAGLMLDLPVVMHDVLSAARLPMHHRDPFDRILVAQALHGGMVLVTPDRALRAYDVPVMDARA